jgi:cell wall-associated NlpC family hydrolase
MKFSGMFNLLKQISKYTFILFFISHSLFAQREFNYGIVSQSVINLRSNRGQEAEMGTQALMGTPVHILETVHGWSSVKTPEGYVAWTEEESVQKMNPSELNVWETAPKSIVTTYFATVRSQPSENAEVVSDVVWGDIMRYLGKKGKYIQVQLPDGRKAFLQESFAMPFEEWLASRRPIAANIIETATRFIGFPYLWGGTSIKGMDCSGFTKTCFFLNGVILPRNASEQAQTGENVDITKDFYRLQPADLLFFGSIKENKEHISHVAIYIGNGRFIHSSGMIHISSLLPGDSLYDAYNTARLLRAQRLITRIDLDSAIVSINKHPFYQQ